jgi:uncharacterized protein (TIGR03437 family)
LTRTAIATVCLAVVFSAGSVNAQLIYTGVSNIYSNIEPGMPNYGIAQGSIFIIGGTDLSLMTLPTASQGVPLQTSLAGVTITVTVGSVTTQAIPYSVSFYQITAILPSKTPVGNGTLTVTSGGQSFSIPVTVVLSAFGLATASMPGGSGPFVAAVAQDDNEGGRLLSQTDAANPGEYLTLWGSGLGPVTGDETQYQAPADLTNIPIEVDIGGVSATVTYHGRSIYPGLDQINVIVPAGVSGCNVSVVVTAGGVPSNPATILVAGTGRICSDPGLIPVTPDEYQGLLSLGSVNVGALSLETLTTTSPSTGAVTSDSAYATFQKFTAQQFASGSFLQVPSMGSCLVTGWAWQPPLMYSTDYALNAGPEIDVNGPYGPVALPSDLGPDGGEYVEPFGTSPPIVPPTGGMFAFSNGSGGPDVGAFKASFSESLTTPLLWTNSSAITAIDRAKGQLITWTGGIPGSYVSIFGYSSIYEAVPVAAGQLAYNVRFICSAPLSAGQFTVPAAVLQSLPPTGTALGNLPPSGNGYLYVASGSIQRFSAPGLDLGLLFFGAGSGISVSFR